MDMVREWIITILSIIIFVTFVEFLLPNSNHKRYINVIIGLLIMLVILKPLMGFVKGGMNIGDGILQASYQLEQKTFNNRMKSLEINNQDTIMKLYKDSIKEQMVQRLESQLDLKVQEISLDIEEELEGQLGMIKGIHIVLLEETREAMPVSSTIKEVKVNVSVSGKSNNNFETDSILLVNGGEAIISDFSSFYQVSRENIRISVLKNK